MQRDAVQSQRRVVGVGRAIEHVFAGICRAMHGCRESGSQCRDARGHHSTSQSAANQTLGRRRASRHLSTHQATKAAAVDGRGGAGLRFPRFPTAHQSPGVGCWSLPDRCLSTATNSAAEGGVFIFVQSIPPVARVHEQQIVVTTESQVDGAAGCRSRATATATTTRLESRTTPPASEQGQRKRECTAAKTAPSPPPVRSVVRWEVQAGDSQR